MEDISLESDTHSWPPLLVLVLVSHSLRCQSKHLSFLSLHLVRSLICFLFVLVLFVLILLAAVFNTY